MNKLIPKTTYNMKHQNHKKKAFILILIIIISLSVLTFVQADKIYSIKIVNTDQGISYSSTQIVEGETPASETEGTHSAYIKDFSNNTVYQTKFTPPFYQTFELFLPYYKNGKSISLQDPLQDSPLSVSVTHFADTCGNNVCEEQENHNECPDDCPSGEKDDYCDEKEDTICDLDCKNGEDQDCLKSAEEQVDTIEPTGLEGTTTTQKFDIDNKSKEPKIPWWIILLILLLLFIIIVTIIVIYDKRKHQQKITDEITNYIAKYQQAGYQKEQIEQALINYGYKEKDVKKIIKK